MENIVYNQNQLISSSISQLEQNPVYIEYV
jgi:hypothetical protein